MADRIYKGRLVVTTDIHEENQKAFSEASENLQEPHKGGLVPFGTLYSLLRNARKVEALHGRIFVQGEGCLLTISGNGGFEISAS